MTQLALLASRLPLTPGRVVDLVSAPTLARVVHGRPVVVTGASSGVGRETALQLGRRGARVLLVARTAAALSEVAEAIRAEGGQAWIHPCDLSDPDAVDRLVAHLTGEHGPIAVLVNNAGRSIRRSIAESEDRLHDFERTMALNYFGALRLTLGLLPGMRLAGGGHVVHVSSMGRQAHTPRFSAYLASKAAFDEFARCLAAEERHRGIRVSTVHLPLVRTAMIEATDSYARAPALTVEEGAAMVLEAIRTQPVRLTPIAGRALELGWAVAPRALEHGFNLAFRASAEGARRTGGRLGRALRVPL